MTDKRKKCSIAGRKAGLKRMQSAIAKRLTNCETLQTSRELARLMDDCYGTKFGSRVELYHGEKN